MGRVPAFSGVRFLQFVMSMNYRVLRRRVGFLTASLVFAKVVTRYADKPVSETRWLDPRNRVGRARRNL